MDLQLLLQKLKLMVERVEQQQQQLLLLMQIRIHHKNPSIPPSSPHVNWPRNKNNSKKPKNPDDVSKPPKMPVEIPVSSPNVPPLTFVWIKLKINPGYGGRGILQIISIMDCWKRIGWNMPSDNWRFGRN